jgi:hypothetical protein
MLTLSCKTESATVSNYELQDLIEVDLNQDIEAYYNHLADEYLDYLQVKYGSTIKSVIIDSLSAKSEKNKAMAMAKSFEVTFEIVDSVLNVKKDIDVFKYRKKAFNPSNKSEMYEEKLILRLTKNDDDVKYIPYYKEQHDNEASSIYLLYDKNLLDVIGHISKHAEIETEIMEELRILNSFENYFNLIDNSNPRFADYLHPKIFYEYLPLVNESNLTYEMKMRLIDDYKKGRKREQIPFKSILVESLTRIPCSFNYYYMKYAIRLNDTLYIPGVAVVFTENDKNYFVEYELDIILNEFPELFDNESLKCLKKFQKSLSSDFN